MRTFKVYRQDGSYVDELDTETIWDFMRFVESLPSKQCRVVSDEKEDKIIIERLNNHDTL